MECVDVSVFFCFYAHLNPEWLCHFFFYFWQLKPTKLVNILLNAHTLCQRIYDVQFILCHISLSNFSSFAFWCHFSSVIMWYFSWCIQFFNTRTNWNGAHFGCGVVNKYVVTHNTNQKLAKKNCVVVVAALIKIDESIQLSFCDEWKWLQEFLFFK